MSHNLEYITNASLSALTIRPRARKDKPALGLNEARITRLGGFAGSDGIRVKIRHVGGGVARTVDIRGEDLYALREFLAELPEEAFVRPADPVEKPERWTDGDIVEEVRPARGMNPKLSWVWVRVDGRWQSPGGYSVLPDVRMESYLAGAGEDVYTIIRQASGQDL